MKIYTQEMDIALQSPKRFWVAPFSDFKIGVKIVKNGTPVDNEFSVFNGETELTPDDDLTNGFTTFTLKSNDTGSVEYKVVVDGVGETIKITQITTDSTVFEVGGSGGGDVPADVATKTWVQNYVSAETSEFVDGNDVDAAISAATSTFVNATQVSEAISAATSEFATTSAVEAAISTATTDMATQTWVGQQGYVSQNDLSIYATTSAMESYVSTATSSFITSAALEPYATASDIASTYATKTELSDYATTSSMTSAISAATSDKVTGGAVGSAPALSSAVAVFETDWATLSASADANTFYVVLPDPV